MKLVINRMDTKISHETGLYTPHISMPVMAEQMLSEKDHMTDNATQPTTGGNILSKWMYMQEPHANTSLAEPESKPIKNDNKTIFFIIRSPYLF